MNILARPCHHLLLPPDTRSQQASPDVPPETVCDQGHIIGLDPCPCDDYVPDLADAERTRCEIWTRVMGYHRPVGAFNAGKQAEHHERRYFREPHLTDQGAPLAGPFAADPAPRYPWPADPSDD